MRYFVDTEFVEDGHTIDLISIGIVAADGREYYAESSEANLNKASEWVRANVFPSMAWTDQKTRAVIAREIVEFVDANIFNKPEFWAYYADYDWVVLCQLFGRMIDLPVGWPMFCRDFKQWLGDHPDENGDEEQLIKLDPSQEHNALADARWLRDEFNRLWLPPMVSLDQCESCEGVFPRRQMKDIWCPSCNEDHEKMLRGEDEDE